MKQYYNILIYCNIYYCNTMQYGLKDISIYCTLQYIAIYCNVCCLNIINTQSLHHKILDYTLQLLVILYGYSGCIFLQNPYSHMKCLLPKSNEILQYGNILQYTQTQYAIQHRPILFHP